MSESKDQEVVNTTTKTTRRRLLGLLAVGGAAGSSAVIPKKWSKPIVNSLLLPAHAQTSSSTMVGRIGSGIFASLPQAPNSMASLGEKVVDFIIPDAIAQIEFGDSDVLNQCISITAGTPNGPFTAEISNVGTVNGTLDNLSFEAVFTHEAGDFTITGDINEEFTQATGIVTDDSAAPLAPNPNFCTNTFTAFINGDCTPLDDVVEQYYYCFDDE